MSDIVKQLLESPSPKEFSTSMKQVQEQFTSQTDFLEKVAEYLPLRLYESYYGDSVPQGFFGIMAAADAHDFFTDDTSWRPYIQQTWSAAKERKRTPWNLSNIESTNGESLEKRWQCFTETANSANISGALTSAVSFLDAQADRDYFRSEVLSYAMSDMAHGGFKFLYLFKAWKFAELLGWKHAEKILFPALHFLVVGPRDTSLSTNVQEYWWENPLSSTLKNSAPVPNKIRSRAEEALLFGDSTKDALEAVSLLSQSGAGAEFVQDALLLTGAQAITNARLGHWRDPIRAFHFVYLSQFWAKLVEPHRQTYALLLGAALIHRASKNSSQGLESQRLDQVAREFLPTEPTKVLRSVVSHSDPYASATAAYAVLEQERDNNCDLATTLMDLAVKNDGDVCGGDDILLIHELTDCYKRSSCSERDRYLVSAAFFLGRIPKSYELFGTYGF